MTRSFLSQTGWVFGTRAALAASVFVADVVVARLLGLEGKGALTILVLTPVMLASVANLGLDFALNEVGHRHPDRRATLATSAATLASLTAVGIGAVVVLDVGGIASWLYAGVPDLTAVDLLLSVALLVLETTFAMSLMHAMTDGAPVVMGVARLVRRATVLVGAIVLAAWGLDAEGGTLRLLLMFHLLGLVAGASVAVWRSGSRPTWPRFSAMRALLPRGMRALPGRLAERLQTRVDVVLLGVLAGAGPVGAYSVAVGLAEIVFFLSSSVSGVLFSRRVTDDVDVHVRAIGWMLPIGLATAVAMAAAGPLAIRGLYGPAFADSVVLLWLLLPATVLFSLVHASTPLLVQRGRSGDVSRAQVAGVATQVVVALVAIPVRGAEGAAWATLSAYGVTSIMIAVRLPHETGRHVLGAFLPPREDVRRWWTAARRSIRDLGE